MFHVEHFENAYQIGYRCYLPEAPTPSAPATYRPAPLTFLATKHSRLPPELPHFFSFFP